MEQARTCRFCRSEIILLRRAVAFTIKLAGKTDLFDARRLPRNSRNGGGECNRERLHKRHNLRLTQITGRGLQNAADHYKFQLF